MLSHFRLAGSNAKANSTVLLGLVITWVARGHGWKWNILPVDFPVLVNWPIDFCLRKKHLQIQDNYPSHLVLWRTRWPAGSIRCSVHFDPADSPKCPVSSGPQLGCGSVSRHHRGPRSAPPRSSSCPAPDHTSLRWSSGFQWLNSDPPSYAAARRISRHIDDSLWKLHVPPAVHRPTPYWGVPRTFRCCQHSHGACCGSRLPFWAAQAWSSSRRVTPRSLWHHFSACLPLLWSPHCPAAGNLPQCSDIPRPHPGYHCIPCKLSGTLDCLRWPQKK